MERKISDLHGKNIVVYDIEIKKEIDKINVGWTDFHKMGISVAVSFDYRNGLYSVHLDDNIRDLPKRLNEEGTLVVGFNIIKFDNNILRKDSLVYDAPLNPDSELNQYDIFQESLAANGLKQSRGGMKLDDHLSEIGLPMKTANGAEAPRMYKEGRIGELISYCVADVTAERRLFEWTYLHKGFLKSVYNPRGYYAKDPANVIR